MSGAGAGPNPGAGAAQDNSGDDVVDGDFRELLMSRATRKQMIFLCLHKRKTFVSLS